MAFVLFFTSVVLATEIGDQCQIALITRCFKVYREDLKDTSESVTSHCFRLQVWRAERFKCFIKVLRKGNIS